MKNCVSGEITFKLRSTVHRALLVAWTGKGAKYLHKSNEYWLRNGDFLFIIFSAISTFEMTRENVCNFLCCKKTNQRSGKTKKQSF